MIEFGYLAGCDANDCKINTSIAYLSDGRRLHVNILNVTQLRMYKHQEDEQAEPCTDISADVACSPVPIPPESALSANTIVIVVIVVLAVIGCRVADGRRQSKG